MYCRESMAASTAALISSSTGGRDRGTGISGILRSRVEPGVLAAEVQERLAARVVMAVGRLHPGPEDRVIARPGGPGHPALAPRPGPLQGRQGRSAPAV